MAYKLPVKFILLTQDWEKIMFIFIFYLNVLNTVLLQLSPGFCFHRAGPQCVENKWSRPSVKRGWDTRSSRHCKERRGGRQSSWHSQGVLLSTIRPSSMSRNCYLYQNNGRAPHHRPQIFSAFFDALVVTKQIIANSFQPSPSCLAQQWARICPHKYKGPLWGPASLSCHTEFDLVVITSAALLIARLPAEFLCLKCLIGAFRVKNY